MALPDLLASESEPVPEAESGPEAAANPASAAESAPESSPRRPRAERTRRPVFLGVGVALTLIALLVLGFFVYLFGLSGLSEQRAQSTLYKTFAGQLAQATAPTGPAAEGAPVAILNIPAIGVSDLVVVEGTAAGDLTRGPGHVRATVLPGQYGVSAIYGRLTTYGGPFAHLMRLKRGDRITVVTGEGASVYVVESFGTAAHPSPDPTKNQLVLMTAGSSTDPSGFAEVSADLWSPPKATPTGWPAITQQEQPHSGNPNALVPLVFWAQALVLVSVAGTVAAHTWSKPAALLCTAPAALALVWAVYENLSLLLSNLY